MKTKKENKVTKVLKDNNVEKINQHLEVIIINMDQEGEEIEKESQMVGEQLVGQH